VNGDREPIFGAWVATLLLVAALGLLVLLTAGRAGVLPGSLLIVIAAAFGVAASVRAASWAQRPPPQLLSRLPLAFSAALVVATFVLFASLITTR
jgi:hypothetical protein